MDKPENFERPLPDWYDSAKLGVFVHWGLYSVPAFADGPDGTFVGYMADLTAMRDITGKNPYAEWYLNALRIPESPTARHHAEVYGAETPYSSFRLEFEKGAAQVDFADWTALFSAIGAEYVVMVTRHLDGYPLWPTSVPHPRQEGYRSSRDLVGDLADAVRAAGMRMGLYYAGGIDWTFVEQPVRTMTDLMAQQSAGADYARYARAHWDELIERYRPSVLWNDMGWPAEDDPRDLFASYYRAVPDGVVNDRWTQVRLPRNRWLRRGYLAFVGGLLRMLSRSGRPVPEQEPALPFDVRTFEYEVPADPPARAWEVTRGLGNSFGYSAAETADDLLTGTELVHLFVDIVARGGRLLLNVGPDGSGRIPDVQRVPLQELAGWLRTAGPAVFGTTPWRCAAARTADGAQVRFTRAGDTLHAIVLSERLAGQVRLRDVTVAPGATVRLLGSEHPASWRRDGQDVLIDSPSTGVAPAHVFAFDRGAS
ncbi:MAG: alpha-L-fucosidase [Microbacterium sp.]|jgi:alpha-L-fucosidase|nr:alpha-L-fucosidase [Microbacterium sp.]